MEMTALTAPRGAVEDATQTALAARALGAEWVVVDGYHFDADYQKTIRRAGLHLLAVDDFGHCAHYSADLVLNQNSNASPDCYTHREAFTRLLLGLPYVLLRREFARWLDWQRQTQPLARRLLVTMGGADPGNLTPQVMSSLTRLRAPHLETLVVVGGANPHYDEVRAAAAGSAVAFDLRRNIQDMPECMARADLAIIAAGGTLWELMFMGCPTMIFARTPLQESILLDLERQDSLLYLGYEEALDQERLAAAIEKLVHSAADRQRMTLAGKRLVDGKGAARVLRAMREVQAGRQNHAPQTR
jgi:UDP-2,4-diacetamido-2,4,6-trideoxy-beta-L-altropyranose hydrolase